MLLGKLAEKAKVREVQVIGYLLYRLAALTQLLLDDGGNLIIYHLLGRLLAHLFCYGREVFRRHAKGVGKVFYLMSATFILPQKGNKVLENHHRLSALYTSWLILRSDAAGYEAYQLVEELRIQKL